MGPSKSTSSANFARGTNFRPNPILSVDFGAGRPCAGRSRRPPPSASGGRPKGADRPNRSTLGAAPAPQLGPRRGSGLTPLAVRCIRCHDAATKGRCRAVTPRRRHNGSRCRAPSLDRRNGARRKRPPDALESMPPPSWHSGGAGEPCPGCRARPSPCPGCHARPSSLLPGLPASHGRTPPSPTRPPRKQLVRDKSTFETRWSWPTSTPQIELGSVHTCPTSMRQQCTTTPLACHRARALVFPLLALLVQEVQRYRATHRVAAQHNGGASRLTRGPEQEKNFQTASWAGVKRQAGRICQIFRRGNVPMPNMIRPKRNS